MIDPSELLMPRSRPTDKSGCVSNACCWCCLCTSDWSGCCCWCGWCGSSGWCFCSLVAGCGRRGAAVCGVAPGLEVEWYAGAGPARRTLWVEPASSLGLFRHTHRKKAAISEVSNIAVVRSCKESGSVTGQEGYPRVKSRSFLCVFVLDFVSVCAC